jgi:CheY-like chemotaxis protein
MSNLGRVEIELNPQMCDPGQVFDSLKNVALTFARERDIRIILRRKEIVNLPTMIDYSRLEQAILNVISNAVKFSRKSGTIEIDLTSSMIDDGKVEYTLSVQDHGIGMSSDFQKTMFDAYTQEDRGEMTDHAGTGIGLSVVKSIVEKMNGRIDIKSKENIGTIVTLVFVFDVCAGAMLDNLQEDYEQKSLEGKTVLYCEDNELNMDIVCAILESENVKVEKAWNGKEGLDTYTNLPEGSLAAILMDIRMPVMDGLTAARAIRNSGREDSKTIPIIAVSANAFEDDKKASKDAGMNSHLSKPVDPKLLISEIKKYVYI